MRKLIAGPSSLIVAAALMAGCSSDRGAKAGTAVGTAPVVLRSGGAAVLQLTAPPGSKVAAQEGELRLATPQGDMQVWVVPNASTLDAGVTAARGQIVSEFKEFKADHTTDLTVAGAPAKHLAGTGREADDDDEGSADVIVFTVGDHAFVACTHGEHLSSDAQAGLVALVQTAAKP